MLADLHGVGGGIFDSPFDVCISGSGPAGMSLALKLAAKRHRVLLLEAGGLHYAAESMDVYKGTNTGLDYFPTDVCRLRFFGGTSNHWSGWCHPMDGADFIAHDHVPYSGWPIGKADLDPYYAETAGILDLHVPAVPDYLQLNDADPNLTKFDFAYSHPVTRFGVKYRQAIESAGNLIALLNANVVDIELNENLGSVSSLRVANYAGKVFRARARCYVLCHGGIENPRTLLNANRQIPAGIGNGKDLMGRFFMDHPHFTVGSALVHHEHPEIVRYVRMEHTALQTASYEPRAAFRDRMKVLNFGIRFVPGPEFVSPAGIRFRQRLRRSICESDTLLPIADAINAEGRVNCPTDVMLKTALEQAPNPASRIRLGKDVDRFGNRRVEVEWRLTELDKHTLRQSALEVGRIMAQKDLGRVRVSEWLLEPGLSFPGVAEDEVGGKHHMGTTRMAASPERGVVDKDLRVFGIDNLYVAGSSVFPTGGHVNPTFTIVQLSLRLADHLHDRIRIRKASW